MRRLPSPVLLAAILAPVASAAACGGNVVVDHEGSGGAGGTGVANAVAVGVGPTTTVTAGAGGMGGTTLNPNDRHENIVLLDGNLTATGTIGSANDSVRATTAHAEGVWYFEATLDRAENGYNAVGVADSEEWLDVSAGSTSNGCGYDSGGGILCYATGVFATAEPYYSGDVIGVAVDLDQRVVYFQRNGAWVGGASPEQGNGFPYGAGAMLPMITLSDDDQTTTNFGALPFLLPVPAGYAPGW